jgi:HEPN domain-containing protein
MADINEARSWTDNAFGDMRVAKHLLSTMHPIPVEIIGFHSQQASEKSLKAVLAYNETVIPRTHEITELVNICKTLGACFDIPEAVADTITEYAVKVRYKQETRDFTENDAEFAVKQAEKVIDMVENYLAPCLNFSHKETGK